MAADTAIDLIINQKDSFQASFTVKDATGAVVDLSNYTANSKFKTEYSASDTTALQFTVDIPTPKTDGVVNISLSIAQTTALVIGTKYVYDVAITSSNTGFKTRIVQGTIKVSPGVT